nr:putative heat shock protein 70 family [Tanacetum cinerariifolium]
NLLFWSSKRQQTISRSSVEAEYRGVANVVAKTAWLRNLLRELHSSLSTATLVYYDNVSTTYLSANPVQHQRTKHIEIDIHFVRDLVTASQSINPDEAVAYAAAVMAAKVSGQITNMLKELVLVDVTPMSLGIESRGGIMVVVIPRNNPIPTQNSVSCFTVTDNQTAIINKVYQGERTRSMDNYLLGQFRITGILPAPKGVSEVVDTFKIDANGILTVTSKVVSTGKTEKLTVTNHSGRLSQQEIEKMVKDAEKYKLEDQEYKWKVDAFNDLEDFLYVVKKKIMMNRYDISAEVLRNIKYAVNDATEWLSNNKDAIEAKKFQLEFISKVAI